MLVNGQIYVTDVQYRQEQGTQQVCGGDGMVAESVAIVVVCVLMVVAVGKSRFPKAVAIITPVAILPVLHLLASGLVRLAKGRVLGVRGSVAIAFVDVIALGLTCALIVVLGRHISNKTAKRAYYIVMVGYSVLMGWVYVFNTLQPLFA